MGVPLFCGQGAALGGEGIGPQGQDCGARQGLGVKTAEGFPGVVAHQVGEGGLLGLCIFQDLHFAPADDALEARAPAAGGFPGDEA